MTTSIHGIYLKREYTCYESIVTMTIQTENISFVAKISEECLLTALKNDLGLEVKE